MWYKTIFQKDDTLFKMLYLTMSDITENVREQARTGGQTLEYLYIYIEDRNSTTDKEQ